MQYARLTLNISRQIAKVRVGGDVIARAWKCLNRTIAEKLVVTKSDVRTAQRHDTIATIFGWKA